MSTVWTLAVSGIRAHRVAMAGTAIVQLLAAVLLSVTGVLLESGLRATAQPPESSPVLGGALLATVASSFAGTALIVVVLVGTATVTLALRARRTEFALLRAVGATPRQVSRTVAGEAALVTLVASPPGAVLGLVVARTLDPLLVQAHLVEPGFAPVVSPAPAVAAVLVLTGTAIVAGRLGARESARLAPTEALRLSAVEPRRLGRGRAVAAVTVAALGAVAALSPMVVPGSAGSASAASSALLLVAAAALAGPALVAWTFDRFARTRQPRRGAATSLALANLGGFSRRLTVTVIPLALIVAVGTLQTSVNRALSTAAVEQLDAAIGTQLVASSPAGLSPEQLAAIDALDGVTSVTPIVDVLAQVNTDPDEDASWLEALTWEAATIRVIPADVPASVFDPGVVRGSLADLHEPGAIAVSTDAAAELGAGLGDVVRVRDGREASTTVVAIYDRALGVGDYLVGLRSDAVAGARARPGTALVGLRDDASVAAVAAQIGELGAAAVGADAYAASAGSGAGGEQRLSAALLLFLLAFVAVGAATALALGTQARRAELTLLRRTGATTRQVQAMLGVESVLTGGAAWLVGSAAVAPAVVGVSLGLLGPVPPVADWATYALLSLGVLLLTVGVVLVAGRAAARRTERL